VRVEVGWGMLMWIAFGWGLGMGMDMNMDLDQYVYELDRFQDRWECIRYETKDGHRLWNSSCFSSILLTNSNFRLEICSCFFYEYEHGSMMWEG
jgi:hypothetical protein